MVAVFEAIKGMVVIATACGLLTLLHKDVVDEIVRLVDRLHFHPEGAVSQVLIRLASNVTDAKLWAVAAAAVFTQLCDLSRPMGSGIGGSGPSGLLCFRARCICPGSCMKSSLVTRRLI